MKSVKVDLKLVCVVIIAIVLVFNGLFRAVISSPIPEIQQALRLGRIATRSERLRIVSVASDSPSSGADLQAGDIIVSVTNKPINKPSVFIELIRQNAGKLTDITIERNGKQLIKQVIPRTSYPPNQGSLGISIGNVETLDIQKTNMLLTIAKVTYDVYSGKSAIFVSMGYKYERLIMLFIGLFNIVVGIYLLKHKKWALYTAFILSIVSVLSSFFRPLGRGEIILSFLLPLFVMVLSGYLLTQRKHFK